jgi:hypothetical protein
MKRSWAFPATTAIFTGKIRGSGDIVLRIGSFSLSNRAKYLIMALRQKVWPEKSTGWGPFGRPKRGDVVVFTGFLIEGGPRRSTSAT